MKNKLIIWIYVIASSTALVLLCVWLDQRFPVPYQPRPATQCMRLNQERIYCWGRDAFAGLAAPQRGVAQSIDARHPVHTSPGE